MSTRRSPGYGLRIGYPRIVLEQPFGKITPGQLQFNEAAWARLGNPARVSLMTEGRDLYAIPGACYEVKQRNSKGLPYCLDLRLIPLRTIMMKGEYDLTKLRLLGARALKFFQCLYVIQSDVLTPVLPRRLNDDRV